MDWMLDITTFSYRSICVVKQMMHTYVRVCENDTFRRYVLRQNYLTQFFLCTCTNDIVAVIPPVYQTTTVVATVEITHPSRESHPLRSALPAPSPYCALLSAAPPKGPNM